MQAARPGTRANCSAQANVANEACLGDPDQAAARVLNTLAMFDLAIDSKLRGCDVVSLKVEDVAPRGITVDRHCPSKKPDIPSV
jgi:hypothetical protein